MSDYRPPEYLRLGGAPARELPPEPVDPVWDAWDADGDPKVSNIGGGLIFSPALVDIKKCPRCPAELVNAQFLRRHLEEKHGRGDG